MSFIWNTLDYYEYSPARLEIDLWTRLNRFRITLRVGNRVVGFCIW